MQNGEIGSLPIATRLVKGGSSHQLLSVDENNMVYVSESASELPASLMRYLVSHFVEASDKHFDRDIKHIQHDDYCSYLLPSSTSYRSYLYIPIIQKPPVFCIAFSWDSWSNGVCQRRHVSSSCCSGTECITGFSASTLLRLAAIGTHGLSLGFDVERIQEAVGRR